MLTDYFETNGYVCVQLTGDDNVGVA